MATRHRFTILGGAAVVALCTSAGAQQARPLRGMAYEALSELPKFAGLWVGARGGGPGTRGQGAPLPGGPQGGPPNAEQLLKDIPPLRNAQVLARYKEAIGLLVSGADNVALAAKYGDVLGGRGGGGAAWRNLGGGLCDAYAGASGFGGRTGGGPESVMEILFTPGRVTITTDRGMIRRIATDGRTTPAGAFVTLTGTSVGRWEGQTLLVETVGLSPKTMIAGVPAGQGFKVDERIYLDDRDLLHIDGTITAPEALTGPYRYTQTYARFKDASFVPGQFVIDCATEDRSIDRTTNQQRFDLTPPAGLPPPPKD